MPKTKRSKYTEIHELAVWKLFSQGKTVKQVSLETRISTGMIYKILEKACAKWGTPKPE